VLHAHPFNPPSFDHHNINSSCSYEWKYDAVCSHVISALFCELMETFENGIQPDDMGKKDLTENIWSKMRTTGVENKD
jgi:hypothetical protein